MGWAGLDWGWGGVGWAGLGWDGMGLDGLGTGKDGTGWGEALQGGAGLFWMGWGWDAIGIPAEFLISDRCYEVLGYGFQRCQSYGPPSLAESTLRFAGASSAGVCKAR